MSRLKRRKHSVAAIALSLLALPALAQQGDPDAGTVRQSVPEAQPRTTAECATFATQRANEEYMAQDSTVRRNSPFQSGPAGARDPYTDSQRQQLAMDRSAREKQLYDSCVARLDQKQ